MFTLTTEVCSNNAVSIVLFACNLYPNFIKKQKVKLDATMHTCRQQDQMPSVSIYPFETAEMPANS